jgi:CheY-like chemotaxis protein
MSKILLADESVTIRKVVELVLSDEGFQVESVSSGDEALAVVQSSAPSLVLVDVKAKGKNGYEVAQAIKGNPATANIPVLLLAGAFEPVNEELVQKSGADGSLVKPFESKDLIEKVRSLVGGAAPAAAGGGEEDIVFDMSGGEEEALEAAPAETLEAVEAEEDDLWDLSEADVVEAAPAEFETVTAESEPAIELESALESLTPAEMASTPLGVAQDVPPQPTAASQSAAASAAPQAAMSPEAVAAVMPGREEMSEIFRQLVAERLDQVMSSIDLKTMLVETLAPTIKESMNKMLYEATPEITEKLLKDAVQESLSTLNEKLESVIWETVPELAENIIRKEIEKIKSEA